MLERTDTDWAPWTLVEADSKRFARVKVLDPRCAAIEEGCAATGSIPAPHVAGN
jgi:polyphosphate kinase 2 (PPK2 family)